MVRLIPSLPVLQQWAMLDLVSIGSFVSIFHLFLISSPPFSNKSSISSPPLLTSTPHLEEIIWCSSFVVYLSWRAQFACSTYSGSIKDGVLREKWPWSYRNPSTLEFPRAVLITSRLGGSLSNLHGLAQQLPVEMWWQQRCVSLEYVCRLCRKQGMYWRWQAHLEDLGHEAAEEMRVQQDLHWPDMDGQMVPVTENPGLKCRAVWEGFRLLSTKGAVRRGWKPKLAAFNQPWKEELMGRRPTITNLLSECIKYRPEGMGKKSLLRFFRCRGILCGVRNTFLWGFETLIRIGSNSWWCWSGNSEAGGTAKNCII